MSRASARFDFPQARFLRPRSQGSLPQKPAACTHRIAEADRHNVSSTNARRLLLALAAVLGFAPCAFDLRSNEGGIAVSGEVTLHADRLYVQTSQPATGNDTGILFRRCEGRRDDVGGVNN
jgi:hypothetical protein